MDSMMPLTLSAAKPKPSVYEFDALGTRWWCEAISGTVDDTLRLAIDDAVQQFVLIIRALMTSLYSVNCVVMAI